MSAETAQVVVSLASVASSIVLSVVAVVAGRRLARYEQHRVMRQGWVELDALALSDPNLLVIAESVMNPGGTGSVESLQKKWFAYIALNNLATDYAFARHGHAADPGYVLALTEYHLSRLMLDDDVFALTQDGYEAEFAKLCRDIRALVAGHGETQRDEALT